MLIRDLMTFCRVEDEMGGDSPSRAILLVGKLQRGSQTAAGALYDIFWGREDGREEGKEAGKEDAKEEMCWWNTKIHIYQCRHIRGVCFLSYTVKKLDTLNRTRSRLSGKYV